MTTREQWLVLAERCERATGHDPHIDREILMGAKDGEDKFFVAAAFFNNYRLYTCERSLIGKYIRQHFPAANIVVDTFDGVSTAEIDTEHTDHPFRVFGRAATPELAQTAAFCRAMAEKA